MEITMKDIHKMQGAQELTQYLQKLATEIALKEPPEHPLEYRTGYVDAVLSAVDYCATLFKSYDLPDPEPK